MGESTIEREITSEEEITGEVRLWQAVLLRTIQEWVSGPLRQQRQAEHYLFHDNTDFPRVCHSAGLDTADSHPQQPPPNGTDCRIERDVRSARHAPCGRDVTGIIRPFSSVNTSPRHSMRLIVKLRSHRKNQNRSCRGRSHSLRRTTGSPSPHTPTT